MASNVELVGLAKDLAVLEQNKTPIRIGLIGCGEMGTDIISRVAHMDGIEIGAIAELQPNNAINSIGLAYGNTDRQQTVDSSSAVNSAIEKNRKI